MCESIIDIRYLSSKSCDYPVGSSPKWVGSKKLVKFCHRSKEQSHFGKMRFSRQKIQSDRRGAHAATGTIQMYGPWKVPSSRGRCAYFIGRAHYFKSHPDDKSPKRGRSRSSCCNCYLANQPKHTSWCRIVPQRNPRIPVSSEYLSYIMKYVCANREKRR